MQPGAPLEALVVTAAGQLLQGSLGGPLKDSAQGSSAVACAAWSLDGSSLAIVSPEDALITVRSAASGAAFSARLQSKVCLMFCQAYS